MVHSIFTKLFLFVLLTRVILHCVSESLETKVDTLADRLNSFLDLLGSRQDLAALKSTVNREEVKLGYFLQHIVAEQHSSCFLFILSTSLLYSTSLLLVDAFKPGGYLGGKVIFLFMRGVNILRCLTFLSRMESLSWKFIFNCNWSHLIGGRLIRFL